MRVLVCKTYQKHYFEGEFEHIVCWGSYDIPNIAEVANFIMSAQEVYKVEEFDGEYVLVKIDLRGDFSIESILWHVYGVLTPQNRALSVYIVGLLDDLDQGKVSKEEVGAVFDKLIAASVCPNQVSTLVAVRDRYVYGVIEDDK